MNYWAIGMEEYLGGGQIVNTIVDHGGIPTGNTRDEYFEQVGVEFTTTPDTDLDAMVSEFTENALYVEDDDGNSIERKD